MWEADKRSVTPEGQCSSPQVFSGDSCYPEMWIWTPSTPALFTWQRILRLLPLPQDKGEIQCSAFWKWWLHYLCCGAVSKVRTPTSTKGGFVCFCPLDKSVNELMVVLAIKGSPPEVILMANITMEVIGDTTNSTFFLFVFFKYFLGLLCIYYMGCPLYRLSYGAPQYTVVLCKNALLIWS